MSVDTTTTGPKPRLWAKSLSIVGGFLLLQVTFFLLLIAGQAVPDEPIIANLVNSVDAGTYGPSGAPDRMGGVSDTFTECVVVGTGLSALDGETALDRAVYMPRISNCEQGADDIRALAADQDSAHGAYYKYWAGYTAITRPVLAATGLEGLRIVAGAMLLGSLALAFSQIARRTSGFASLGLLAPLVISTNLMSTPSTSFSQAMSISFIMISTALVAWGAGGSWTRLICSTSLGAALFCFVDLLTTPAIPWALGAVVGAVIVFCRSGRLGRASIAGVGIAVLWPLSFGLTWVSRWVIAAAFLGWEEVMAFVRSNVEYRTTGEWPGVEDAFGVPTRKNVLYWWDQIPTAPWTLLVMSVLVCIVMIVVLRRHGVWGALSAVVLSLPALIIPVWYEVLSNHSQIHTFFAYRGVPTMLGIVLFACVAVALSRPPLATSRGSVSSGRARSEPVLQHDEKGYEPS
ncbi:hypothetical protein FJV46_04730 [Arthrobacter agilis]|uniref:hypothetical protein n=1 Tax=Arthrobacter agilis TaxID=37921 RepID=UPI000B356A4E|nr:hypothetical protein [Arthrobacter agilis]OUM41313.1 hypothetical protein B8W74_10315 [Arthrobacter agilis]PPB46356.1 hypothetical protein CI784_08580 [Arthrobacter agilis]TPV27113.1 hypothetical protein FJV46_04730 [Arthrobacter agilis]VDR32718.1 Uncharacterised protein [Arthrobacter agilis]